MNTYDPNTLYQKPKKKKNGKKGFIIFLAIVAVILGISIAFNAGVLHLGDKTETYKYDEDYIGVLEVHGTMYGDGSDLNYNQDWLLERINQMMNDKYNRGLMLSIDTPGGEVYAIDELYLKIKAYQDTTGRPVYAYMESMAASGGYYIAAPAERIFANRNCWTGSIGVTAGTIYDISGFLEDMGVKTVTITAGDNKAMGSAVDPLTKEQREIYQSLVDEAYEQFVHVVATGRDMKIKRVKELADGRIYTAKQAKENGLIDEISTRDEAIAAMKEQCGLKDASDQIMSYEPDLGFGNWLMGLIDLGENEAKTEYDQIMKLMGENQKFTVTYLAEIRK